MKIQLQQLMNAVLAPLPSRQREIIEGRYGVHDGKELTLAALGKKFKITRERVRQIQNLALQVIVDNKQVSGLESWGHMVVQHVHALGGLRQDETLIDDVRGLTEDHGDVKTFPYKIHFLLVSSHAVHYHPSDRDARAFWFVHDEAKANAQRFVDGLIKNILHKKEAVLVEKKFDEYFIGTARECGMNDFVCANFVAVSKKITANAYGDIGLTAWPEIYPKTARDWAYLILKKEGKSLHFQTISARINTLRNKKTNFQTVHNELIKDERFVLVGRGIYGLREFGLIEGTAREVLSQMIQERGPMRARDLVKLVLERRIFKENTLLLNLQKRDHFRRLGDGRYDVREV